jgi:hypothetical protein
MLDDIVAGLNADGFPATRDDLIGEGIRSYLKIPREQLEAFLAGDWSPTAYHKES